MRPSLDFTRQSSGSDRVVPLYKAPAPELDDHTRGRGLSVTAPSVPALEPKDHSREGVQRSPKSKSPREFTPAISPGTKGNVPGVEVQAATPQESIAGDQDLLKVNDALKKLTYAPVARDFEQAIVDDDDDAIEEGFTNRSRHGSPRRGGRRGTLRFERSRDTSVSGSTSPANSIEAFAEPRRRQRSNTLDSFGSLADFVQSRQHAASLDAGTRRPTVASPAPPGGALTHRSDEQIPDDVTVDLDEEPGKTYRIDFEELDEYVALCAQGMYQDETPIGSERGSGSGTEIFGDLRKDKETDIINNVALNPDTFHEKVMPHHTPGASDRKPSSMEKPRVIADCDQDPNRFTFFSTEMPETKRATKLGGLIPAGESFRDLFDLDEEGGVWWLDVLNPTKSELEVIAKAFKIHRLTREDIETQESREKVELFSQYYFVSFRSFVPDKNSEDFLDPLHVYIVVTEDGVLSFSYMDNLHARNVRKRILKLGDFVSLGPDYICYAMIDDIVDSFAPIIHEAEMESSNIEDAIFIAREEDYISLLRQIVECRKKVLNMMRLLGGKADVIKGFAKRCNENFNIAPRGDIGLYLGDIQDHVVTMMSNLVHVEKMLSRSHANYLAQLNVDSILQGTRSSKALAKLTVFATVIVPLNIVTGLFGMNVHVPGQPGQPADEPFYWFGGILAFMALFVICTLAFARKMKYC